ncbi:MAG: LytTR family DNA-binding domain-containing protein [Thermoflexibacter sp.]|jgi:DNA-binding LytR/AlgR family response regulator|nr:LytTR family DNA-binding domain-containing protein [Thermoflexibacter sp.]
MMIKCAIIDDESLAIKLLADYVQKTPTLELVGKFNKPTQALPLLQREEIDLLFLDIEMPELTGLEFIKLLKNKPFIILTTAYSQYAIDGFDLDVSDYLLKPVTFERFLKAVNKVSEIWQLKNGSEKNEQTLTNAVSSESKDYFWVKADQKLQKIFFKDILYIEGLKEYISIYTIQNQRIITLEALKNLEESLPCPPFVRCHKSYIVSLDKVTAMIDNQLEISKKLIPIGASYKEQVIQKL